MSHRPEQITASMSSFIDFATTSGPPRVAVVSDHKKNRTTFDFYRPMREALAEIGRRRLDPDKRFDALLSATADTRAAKIFPGIIEGWKRFRAAHPGRWVEPVTAALKVGDGLRIAVNPEVGYEIDGIPHHLKLYLRSEPLGQRRVDFTVALMTAVLPFPREHRLAVLDLRNGQLAYLSSKAASPTGWQRLSTLVHVEAAAYAAAWARV